MVTRSDTQNSTALQDRTQGPTPWNVVLIDDDEHTYEYVIRVLQELFRWDRAKPSRWRRPWTRKAGRCW